MVAVTFGGGTSPKGKGVTVGILLLVMTFLLGTVAAWQPPLDLTVRIERAVITEVDFDIDNPPIWAIRPADREAYLANKAAGLSNAKFMTPNAIPGGDPCVNRKQPAIVYHSYYADDCKPNYKLDEGAMGSGLRTCLDWNTTKNGLECASFCQERTVFEWAEERPYPNSDCHYPIKCSISEGESTSAGWSISGSPKVGKALKMGISGNYHQNSGVSHSHSFAVELTEELKCGYFTFVPIKKIICGRFSSSEPGMKFQPGEAVLPWCDTREGPTPFLGARRWWAKDENLCRNEMWQIEDRNGKLIPDGVTIFVYTNCATRTPLAMKYQDDVYSRPGVALPHKVVRDLHDSWIFNTCHLGKLGVTKDGKEYKSLYMTGLGFSDDQIGGPNGEGLFAGIRKCANGDVINEEFSWFDHGRPEDGPHLRGAAWHVRADLPVDMDGGCVGQVLMDHGGISVDRCGDGS
ncbi:hypothetical protein CSOJ01_11310 [Colletotrichum sojae]|uniref:Uncharacterized protein n=1 Tax=Colletotrichum sojae TaxID=2175907 RepID=A0A8H6IYH7_9PEZI|nr:hypothetical protein CSOJ01_11310 [Colletotrichum sojae]